MTSLSENKCEACRADAPKLSELEFQALKVQIPHWQLIEQDGVKQLLRVFTFANFADAFLFTQRVADIAEQEGHHPAILLEWGKVTVRWWTHKIGGLHRNDVIMAAKTDAI